MDQRLRELADHLLRKRDAAEFSMAAIPPHVAPYLFILDIIDGVEDGLRLRVRSTGDVFDRTFGRDLDGRYLDEFIHGPRAEDVMDGFYHCAKAHEPLWMRQVVRLRGRLPRFVEGIAVYLEPASIYGGLVVGQLPTDVEEGSFESYPLFIAGRGKKS
jgi:hypothetical protein